MYFKKVNCLLITFVMGQKGNSGIPNLACHPGWKEAAWATSIDGSVVSQVLTARRIWRFPGGPGSFSVMNPADRNALTTVPFTE